MEDSGVMTQSETASGVRLRLRGNVMRLLETYRDKVWQQIAVDMDTRGVTAWPVCYLWATVKGEEGNEEVDMFLRFGNPPPRAERPYYLQDMQLEFVPKLPGTVRKVPMKYRVEGGPTYVRVKDMRVITPEEWQKIAKLGTQQDEAAATVL